MKLNLIQPSGRQQKFLIKLLMGIVFRLTILPFRPVESLLPVLPAKAGRHISARSSVSASVRRLRIATRLHAGLIQVFAVQLGAVRMEGV